MADFFFKSTDSEQERRTKLNMLIGSVADSQGAAGTSITSLNRTGGDGSPGTVDTYTLGMSDGSTFSFDVYNGTDGVDGINGVDGNGIVSVVLTGGDGSPGTTDVYTISYTKSSPTTFNVYNGLNGTGTGDMLASSNLSDLVDKVISRTNLNVYSTIEIDSKFITEAPTDGKLYGRKDSAWVETIELLTTIAPILSGPIVVNETSSIDITIDNYSSTATYSITSVGGSTSINGDTITYAADSVIEDTAGSISVSAKELLENESSYTQHNFTIQDVATVVDQALVYDSATMIEFTTLSNVSLSDTNTTLESTKLIGTNIISAASADTFTTTTEIVNGDILNVDGIEMIASGVTFSSPDYTVSTIDVTAGGTPSIAYIYEHRALSNVITQDAADTDFTGLSNVSSSFDFAGVSTPLSSADTLVSYDAIKDGDIIDILLDDLSTHVNLTASSVVSNFVSIPNTYTIDTTSATSGQIPSRAFLTNVETFFEIEDGVFDSCAASSSLSVFTKGYKNFAIATYTGNGATQDIVTGINSVDFTVSGNGSGFWLDKATFEVRDDIGNVVTSGETDWSIYNATSSETPRGLCRTNIKNRTSALASIVVDGLRGAGKNIYTDLTNSELDYIETVKTFNSNGVTIGISNNVSELDSLFVLYQDHFCTHIKWGVTNHGKKYVEAYNPVTKDYMELYEGSGLDGHQLPHSLGVAVDYIDVKNITTANNWNSGIADSGYCLNLDNAFSTIGWTFSDTSVLLSTTSSGLNSVDTFIMYGKAKSKTWTIVEYIGTGIGTAGNIISTKDVFGVDRKVARLIGKAVSAVGNWEVYDNKRGVSPSDDLIWLNLSNAENVGTDRITWHDTGFEPVQNLNESGVSYIALVEFDTYSTGDSSFVPDLLSSSFSHSDVSAAVSSRTLRTKQRLTSSSKMKSLTADIIKLG